MSEPQVETQVETQFDELDIDTPLVGIVMGSNSDMAAMDAAAGSP